MNYLVDSIKDYIIRKETDYAILINGAWGSGKTYLWNNLLKNEIEEIDIDGEKYKTIYVSLYGINNLDEISKSLFVQAFSSKHEVLKKLARSKVGNAIPEVGKLIMNGAGLFGLSVGEKDVDLSKLSSFENTVLCFDDLERANMEVTEILGYINNFVEHDHIKTIIIANEKEISEKITKLNYELKALTAISLLDKMKAFEEKIDTFTRDKQDKRPNSELIMEIINDTFDKTNEYKRIKEKLIGKTLLYTPNYEGILNNLIDKYKENVPFYNLIIENKNKIMVTFNVSKTWNLRILKHSLNDFEVIYNEITTTYPNIGKDIIVSLLVLTLALSFETKSGTINPKVFSELNSNSDYTSVIYGYALTKSKEDEPIVKFNNKYFEGTYTNNVFFKFVETFVNTGFFRKDIMVNEINNILDSDDDSVKPSYKKLFYSPFWQLSDEAFDKALIETFDTVKNGDMHHVCYFRGYLTFYDFDRLGLLKPEMKEYDKLLLEGLELTRGKYPAKEDLSMDFILASDSELADDETLKNIKHKIIEINKEANDESTKNEISKIFKFLMSDIYRLKRVVDERYYCFPIFCHYDMGSLFENLITLSNSNLIDFKNFIEYRYKHVIYYKDEYDSFIDLQKLIEEYTKGKTCTLKISIMNELSKSFKDICVRIQALDESNQQ
jgi:hypothetical protein